MPEETLWKGTSSQVKNLGPWISCILIVTIPWAIYRWLAVKTLNVCVVDGWSNRCPW